MVSLDHVLLPGLPRLHSRGTLAVDGVVGGFSVRQVNIALSPTLDSGATAGAGGAVFVDGDLAL